MQFDREAILAAAADQDAAKLATFRAGLHLFDTRALRTMAATHRRHLANGTRDQHYGPRLEAIEAELAKPSRRVA
jgi:hypothetical protein